MKEKVKESLNIVQTSMNQRLPNDSSLRLKLLEIANPGGFLMGRSILNDLSLNFYSPTNKEKLMFYLGFLSEKGE